MTEPPFKAMSLHAAAIWLRRVHENPDLSTSARAVAGVLFTTHNRKTGQCNPPYSKIAAFAGLSRRTAISAVAELIAAGFLIRTHQHWRDDPEREHRNNAYQLTGVGNDGAEETPPGAADSPQRREKPSFKHKSSNNDAAASALKHSELKSPQQVEALTSKLCKTARVFAQNRASDLSTSADAADFELRTGGAVALLDAYRAINAQTGTDWSPTLGPALRNPAVRRAVATMCVIASGECNPALETSRSDNPGSLVKTGRTSKAGKGLT